jgi:uridine kinase
LARIGGEGTVQIIALDSYYRDNPHLSPEERTAVNYDHPDAFEAELLRMHLDALREGHAIDVPVYEFATHSRSPSQAQRVAPSDVIVVEGILALHFPELREVYSYSVFVETGDELRFQRRLKRDVRERGRTEESVHVQWNDTVHPMHVQYCQPTRAFATEVITGEEWSEGELTELWKRIIHANA